MRAPGMAAGAPGPALTAQPADIGLSPEISNLLGQRDKRSFADTNGTQQKRPMLGLMNDHFDFYWRNLRKLKKKKKALTIRGFQYRVVHHRTQHFQNSMKGKSDSIATYVHDQETPKLEKKIKGESHDLSDSMPKNKTRMSPKSKNRTKNDDAATETDYGGPVTRNARTKYQGQFCAEQQNGCHY